MKSKGIALSALLITAATLRGGQGQPAGAGTNPTGLYAVSETLKVGGEGGWDYITVDAVSKLLFVPRTTHTLVLDAVTGKTVGDIPGQLRNHGVAIVPASGRGFISDGKDASVTIFDLKTYKALGKVKADVDADGIIYDSASKKVLVVCGDARSVIPISPDVDPTTGRADAAIDLGGKPEGIAPDGQGKVYIALVDKAAVAVLDSKGMKVDAKWPVAPGGMPVGLSIDPAKRRLFVGCRGPQKLIVMSADDGKVLADLPIGSGVDATQFDGDAFASCRDGSLAIARETSPGKFEIIQNLLTKQGAKTCGVDPATHTLYLPTAEFAPSKSTPEPGTFMVLVVRRSK